MTTAQDALSALASSLGMVLEFQDGTCDLCVGDQPFSIREDDLHGRLVLSALVADDLPDEPSRALVCDLLDLGFGMMEDGTPAVGRDPETGFLAAFAFFPLATLSAAEFPDAFGKFAAFAATLAERLDRESVASPGVSPASGIRTPSAFGADGFLAV
ncbi:MAG: CesT family type III secretion system chaperone [Kiritimatiellae bacterium]|nr:CesT family type III secretion system chaperone [Kiritimatiellia bacterium]